jgi:hypothetical protein
MRCPADVPPLPATHFSILFDSFSNGTEASRDAAAFGKNAENRLLLPFSGTKCGLMHHEGRLNLKKT